MVCGGSGVLRFLPRRGLTILVFFVFLESICVGVPLSYTNAASASDLKPQQVGPPSYWIGSHTLDFTPNPFLRERQSRSNSIASGSNIVLSSVLSTPVPDITNTTTTTSTPKPRTGRRIKGRRKIRNGNRASNKSSREDLVDKKEIKNTEKSEVAEKNVKTTDDGLRRSAIVTERLWPGKVLDVSPTLPTIPAHEIISITTPEPILLDYPDSYSNQIPVDFTKVHPEKLNPSYFRNIILKAMMDRLVGVGLATHAPTALIHD